MPVIMNGPKHGICEHELGDYYDHPFFGTNSLAKQLWFQDELFRRHDAIASVGMMSGGMDGAPMFFGRKTVYLARRSDVRNRMLKVSPAVPNLMWQPVEYQGDFEKLTPAQLTELEKTLWPG